MPVSIMPMSTPRPCPPRAGCWNTGRMPEASMLEVSKSVYSFGIEE